MSEEPPKSGQNPLARDLQTLGQLVRSRRVGSELSVDDTADYCGIAAETLSRLENGEPFRTDQLFKVLEGLGLAMMVLPRSDADIALRALGHAVKWHATSLTAENTLKATPQPALEHRSATPTLFVDYDGTLHAGHALLDTTTSEVTLDSGRPLLEYAPLLAEMLEPYPAVEIVLTTSWLQKLPFDQVLSYLPQELGRRVVGTTLGIKPRLSYVLNGSERTYVITSYVYGKGLKNWMAIDDSVYGTLHFGRTPGEFADRFVLLDSSRGIRDEEAQRRIRGWLSSIHGDSTRGD